MLICLYQRSVEAGGQVKLHDIFCGVPYLNSLNIPLLLARYFLKLDSLKKTFGPQFEVEKCTCLY
jgi:hypothetical protein